MKKNHKSRFTMRVFFTLFIIAELLLTIILATFLVSLLQNWFHNITGIPDTVWLVIVSAILGSAITTLLIRAFFDPISKLGTAMRKVAEGDFSVRLDENKAFPDIRQINRNFNLMTKELQATEILQTDFVSNVSHEFKTPINAIEGYATLLQDTEQPISPEQAEYIKKILLNTGRLSTLVSNMLLLSKVDNQNIQTHVTTYRLDEQIRQSILSLESRWMQRNTEFDVDMERLEYTGNESLLMHVWNNLIENAIKYGPEGGLIRMKLVRRSDVIVFTIEDEGPGISEEAQKHIFDRFYQADNSRKGEGNGLGLALVKQILKLTDGTISVENLPGKGCCFTVRLKAASN